VSAIQEAAPIVDFRARRRQPGASNPHLTARGLGFVPAWILLVLLCVTMILPLVFVLLTALRPEHDYLAHPAAPPHHLTFSNFKVALVQAHFGQYIGNTMIVVIGSILLVLALSTAAGFAFTFIRFPLRGPILLTIVALMVLPPTLFLFPTFDVILRLKLLNSFVGVILVDVASSLPFGIYLMAQFSRAVPQELLDSARVDGATIFQAFRFIALPIVRPAMKTLTLLTFLGVWNELLWGLLIMQSPNKRLLSAGLALLNSDPTFGGDVKLTVIAAALVIAALPPFILYVIFNRTLVRGLTIGSLK
jgi:ABC-type glycerol-3-phosphate transport system permease component